MCCTLHPRFWLHVFAVTGAPETVSPRCQRSNTDTLWPKVLLSLLARACFSPLHPHPSPAPPPPHTPLHFTLHLHLSSSPYFLSLLLLFFLLISFLLSSTSCSSQAPILSTSCHPPEFSVASLLFLALGGC